MKQIQFTSLEMRHTVELLSKNLGQGLPCRNVHWISRDTLERLAVADGQVWHWTTDAQQNVMSLRPVMLEKLFELWKLVAQLPIPRSLSSPQTISHDGKLHILAPVTGPQSSRVIGYFIFEQVKRETNPRLLKSLANYIAKHSAHMEFCWQYSLAKSQSFVDDLTSLYNQRYLPIVFEHEIARMDRHQKKFSVLFLDIDFFKRVNDTRGHWIGSRLLVEVSRIIKRSIRNCDYAFRYGGDEFLVVLVDSSAETGQKVAERIRSAIEHHEFLMDGDPMKLTVSIGLAIYPDHAKSTMELIQLADRAMYDGKHKSRNIVFLAG